MIRPTSAPESAAMQSATTPSRQSTVPTAAPSTAAAFTSPNPIEAGDRRCSANNGSVIASAPPTAPIIVRTGSSGCPTTDPTPRAANSNSRAAPNHTFGSRRCSMSITAAGTNSAIAPAAANGTAPTATAPASATIESVAVAVSGRRRLPNVSAHSPDQRVGPDRVLTRSGVSGTPNCFSSFPRTSPPSSPPPRSWPNTTSRFSFGFPSGSRSMTGQWEPAWTEGNVEPSPPIHVCVADWVTRSTRSATQTWWLGPSDSCG